MTTTAAKTLASVLTDADPNTIADALRQVDLGNLLQSKEYDTGTITGATSITLPEAALNVQAVRVVTGTSPAGPRVVQDSGATPGQIGTSGLYTVKLGTDGKTLTFEANVTRVVVRYVPAPATLITNLFEQS